jgi:uncharacterized protein
MIGRAIGGVRGMISVTIRDNGFSIFGHAEYEEYGKDIVCSAVSFLAQTIAHELDVYNSATTHQESGMMDVKIHDTITAESNVLLQYFENSVTKLSLQYPKNVRIKKI